MARRKITLQNIADVAGCSKGTVSAVLNKSKGNIVVGDALREKIQQAARQLGYEVDRRAQSLSSGRSQTIGLLGGRSLQTGQHTGMMGQLINGIDTCVRRHGYDLMILGPAGEGNEIVHAVRSLRQGRIDALIMPSLIYNKGRKLAVLDDDLPIVLAVMAESSTFPHVYIDFDPGIRAALQHLQELGHHHVLWASWGSRDQDVAPFRFDSFRRMAEEVGFSTSLFRAPASSHRTRSETIIAFRDQFGEYLDANPNPPAILVYNELAALGAYQALQARDLQIPDDVSIIGFDDIWADLCIPPLAVVSLNFTKIGRASARLALKLAEHGSITPELRGRRELIATDLVLRESTGPCSK